MKTKYWILLLGAVLVLSALSGFFLMKPAEDATQAQILSEGKVLRIVDLAMDQEFEITTAEGRNVVTVKDGKIAVTEANCPDHYCMDRGFVGGGTPIVCLPNRLVIEFLGEQEVDSIVG